MPDATKTLIRAAWVAPMDRPMIRDGAVLIVADRIANVGPADALARAHSDAIVQDWGDAVVLPGLINAHAHLELSDLARPPHGGPLADWLIEVIKASPRESDAERVSRAVASGISHCLRFGVTTVGDITRQPALSRPVVAASPLRAVSFGEVQAMAGRRHLLQARLAAAADRTHENERLRIGLSPHAPYSVEPEGYARVLELARTEGLQIATHLAESPDEAAFLADHSGPFRKLWEFLNAWDDAVSRFAGGPIRFAESLGLLDVPAVLAHANYCDDAELALLAAGRASVVYCPRTHAYFGHPPHRWRDMLAAGVNVAIGTDSLASSPNLNLVEDLRLLRRLAPYVPAADLWQLVTVRAARALHMEALVGSLTPGKAADLVAFSTRAGDDPLSFVLDNSVLPSHVWSGGQQFAATLTDVSRDRSGSDTTASGNLQRDAGVLSDSEDPDCDRRDRANPGLREYAQTPASRPSAWLPRLASGPPLSTTGHEPANIENRPERRLEISMRDTTLNVEELEISNADAAAVPAAPDVVALPEVLRQVRRDSRKAPEAYLDETTVRYGGE